MTPFSVLYFARFPYSGLVFYVLLILVCFRWKQLGHHNGTKHGKKNSLSSSLYYAIHHLILCVMVIVMSLLIVDTTQPHN